MTEAENVRNIKTWPRWPFLPLKRYRDGAQELGVVYADDIDLPHISDANGPIRVFDINVFQTSARAAAALTAGVECPWPIHKTYANVEAMLNDGWRGD